MNDMAYLTTEDIVARAEYPFTAGQLRHLLRNRKTNGLNSAVRKIGKRIYIRKDLFDLWIEKHASMPA